MRQLWHMAQPLLMLAAEMFVYASLILLMAWRCG